MQNNLPKADVCLILEGTYPYITGGVSKWAHELILAQNQLTFSLVCILAPDSKLTLRYELPKNVIGIKNIFLQQLPKSKIQLTKPERKKLFQNLEVPLLNLQHNADLNVLKHILDLLNEKKEAMSGSLLLNSEEAWRMVQRMYLSTMGESSFINYFWSWRSLIGSFYSTMLSDLPLANIYHTLCTGYAGLFLARAYIETGSPCLATEHGIYMNERKIEITSAEWIEDKRSLNLNLEKRRYDRDLKSYWIDTFSCYSKLCYLACKKIITLFEGNRELQMADGAEISKLLIIPNGVDYGFYSQKYIEKTPSSSPTIAFIGRIVPIKDVKSLIRAIALLKDKIPEVKALIIGPTNEDKEYYQECLDLIEGLELKETVTFTGKANIVDLLPSIDILVLTSISEAQPLVILEAGAAGIPSVATNIGACYEMLYGRSNESPHLGIAGLISELANPESISKNIFQLLSDKKLYQECSKNIRERVKKYYNQDDVQKAYTKLYQQLLEERSQKE